MSITGFDGTDGCLISTLHSSWPIDYVRKINSQQTFCTLCFWWYGESGDMPNPLYPLFLRVWRVWEACQTICTLCWSFWSLYRNPLYSLFLMDKIPNDIHWVTNRVLNSLKQIIKLCCVEHCVRPLLPGGVSASRSNYRRNYKYPKSVSSWWKRYIMYVLCARVSSKWIRKGVPQYMFLI